MRKNLIVVLLLLTSSMIFAEEISLSDCIEAALRNNLKLMRAEESLKNAETERTNSLLDFLPAASVNASASRDIDENEVGSAGVTVAENLYLFDDRIDQLKLSGLDLKAEKIFFHNTRQGTALNVMTLYTSVLQLVKTAELYRNSVELYQGEEEFIRELMKVGKRTELDLLSTRIELQNARLQLKQAENELAKKWLELSQETGLELTGNNKLAEIDLLPEAKVLMAKPEANPDLKLENIYLKQTTLRKWNSLKNIFPQLYAGGEYSYKEVDYWQDGNPLYDMGGNYIDPDGSQEYWELSLNMSFTFGDLGQKINNYAINKRNWKKQRYSEIETSQRVERELKSKLLDLKLKQEEVKIGVEKKELADKKFLLAQDRFHLGLISFLDYKTAMNERINSRLELLKASHDYLLTYAEWQKMNGEKILGKY